ncbi:MAG TPA: DUF1569 domain-containing protein [Gemmatimonadaceae bacterium]|nr:DUF1569 domain-containing protein [Gemmatimonadaceae bacterium]
MKSLWQQSSRNEILARLDRLTPTHPPEWGRMTAPDMVAHISDSLRMAFGDLPTRSKRLPLRYPPLKQLILYFLPFPKNAPTAPELRARPPGEWVAELDACRALVGRFATESRARRWPSHPAFGALTARQWGIIGYRHLDHHLRQFRV